MSATYEVYADWERFDGRTVKLDDIECVIRVRVWHRRYPTECKVIDVFAEPTGNAKRTAFYRGMRSKFGDDWSTDVLSSDCEVQADLLRQLG